jgi:mono/diheme cytochrome c family protein
LTAGFLLVLLGSDVLHLSLASGHVVVALLIATVGAVLFGGVLGALQWLVVRERVPIPRRAWVTANIGPALLAWLLVIMPAVIEAQNSHKDASVAYLLAASQALALARCSACHSRWCCARSPAAGPGGSGPTSSPG